MKTSELRELGIVELEEKLVEMRTNLAKERATIASGTRAEKPATIGNLRKGIARVLTIMAEKQPKVNAKEASK